ncbi:MAG: NAD(P)/FAD-dependent oxidoreductase [Candidatus Hydrothermarchaeales archaeon]
MDYDVVVVGAGPAGSMVARTLAENGASVLVVEKRPEIGMPVRCGEATGLRTLQEFAIPKDERFIVNETNGVYIFSPDGTRAEMLSSEPNTYILERRYFDKYLAIQAARAGAEVVTKAYATGLLRNEGAVRVKLKRFGDNTTIKCKCVVGADGVESKVGRWVGIDTRTPLQQMSSSVQFEIAGVDVDPDILEFYFGNRVAPKGYVWVFPKGKDVANVGLGVRGHSATAFSYLKKFIASKPNLRKGSVVGIVAGGVPVEGPVKKSVADGVLLVGDAARQVDPLTGGGIYNAMHCGVIAGQVITEALEREDFSAASLSIYEERWRAEIGQKLLKSQRIKEAMEKLSDSDLNKIVKAMQNVNWGDMNIKDVTKMVFRMPPELLNFIRNLLKK